MKYTYRCLECYTDTYINNKIKRCPKCSSTHIILITDDLNNFKPLLTQFYYR